ncbi:MAG: metallophosphoesterase [Thermofilaceae archaeon]|nr:metallophosphoesterase [Thermofilaceae archaeon]MCX8181281.1 metallophosphoesterase [Thermofilaceae archaeon]MDW8004624.1 metallophosphoesterase family protein [Thermofilaceae archaeon]
MNDGVRLLCISDVHGRQEAARELVSSIEQSTLKGIDAIVIAGDVGSPQREDAFYSVIKELMKFDKPVLYIRGNWDVNLPTGILNEEPLVADLEFLSPLELKGMTIVGHATSLKPSKEFTKRPLTLVTHYPPFSVLDKGKKAEVAHYSPHTGLPEINYLVAHYKPVVHVFGHCHALGGVEVKHGGVTFVNVSRLDRVDKNGEIIGNYALIFIGKNGNVDVKWRFINGVWKQCSRCGKRVNLPSEWSLCRKCASRFELNFKKLDKSLERIIISVREINKNEFVFRDNFYIPVTTLKDEEAYEDFIEYLIFQKLKEIALKDNYKILSLTKDKVIEYYTENPNSGISFSEYLFSCNEEKMGKKVCILMKLYILDKKAQVLWKIKHKEKVLESEYVLAKEEIFKNNNLANDLENHGFIPLSYSVEKAENMQAFSNV